MRDHIASSPSFSPFSCGPNHRHASRPTQRPAPAPVRHSFRTTEPLLGTKSCRHVRPLRRRGILDPRTMPRKLATMPTPIPVTLDCSIAPHPGTQGELLASAEQDGASEPRPVVSWGWAVAGGVPRLEPGPGSAVLRPECTEGILVSTAVRLCPNLLGDLSRKLVLRSTPVPLGPLEGWGSAAAMEQIRPTSSA